MNRKKSIIHITLIAALGAIWISGSAAGQGPFDDRDVSPGTVGSSNHGSAPVPQKPENSLAGRVRGFFSNLLHKGSEYKDKSLDLLGQGKDIFEKEKNLPGFVRQGKLSESARVDLLKLARKHPDRAWKGETDIALSKNAHRTNTIDELREALNGPYDWFEADIRKEGPLRDFFHLNGERRPIASHDPYQTNGMLLEDWLSIVKESGRGIKLDLKDSGTLTDVLVLLKKHRISDEKLILNIGIPDPGPGDKNAASLRNQPVNDARLPQIRKAFPRAILNLSPGTSTTTKEGLYTSRQVDQMIRYAKAAGQPVMFPLKGEMVSKEIVRALKPFGKVAIWNDPNSFNPPNVDTAAEKFRSWGVDGMIDLRQK